MSVKGHQRVFGSVPKHIIEKMSIENIFYYQYNAESIDGLDTTLAGTGTVSLDNANGRITQACPALNDVAMYRKIIGHYHEMDWSYETRFKATINMSRVTNETFFLVRGDYTGVNRSVGFSVLNGILRGGVANGACSRNGGDRVLLPNTDYHLEARLAKGVASFFLDGALMVNISECIPTGVVACNHLMTCYLRSNAAGAINNHLGLYELWHRRG